MKYQPSLPEHNDNVSHRKPLREFLLIMAALSALALALFWLSGLAIDWAVERMSPEMEARIQRALAVPAEPDKSARPALQVRLQQMTDALRACAGIFYPVTVQVEESELPNAFALPGARIVVFTGLLDKVSSQNGLSFVLAHELSHLKNRDHLRGLGRGLLLIAVSTLLTGARSDLTQILVPANQVGAARHSQARETAADSSALDILECRFGHAGGATEFFEQLLEDKDEPIGLGHFLDSHPAVQARIADQQRLIRERGYRIAPVVPLAADFKAR